MRLETAVRNAVTELRTLAALTSSASDGEDVARVADVLERALDARCWTDRLADVRAADGEVLVTIHGSHVEPSPGFPALVGPRPLERLGGAALPAGGRRGWSSSG